LEYQLEKTIDKALEVAREAFEDALSQVEKN
jgi:hypothetical protein